MGLWFKGVNPTADLCLFANDEKSGVVVLVVRRAENCDAEAGRLALPGGFVDTDAKTGEEWLAGREEPAAAAARETMEETGVLIVVERLVRVGFYEGSGRDPRDTGDSWSASHAFVACLSDVEYEAAKAKAGAGDETQGAFFISVKEALESGLAFDHERILRDAFKVATSGPEGTGLSGLSLSEPPVRRVVGGRVSG